MEPEGEELGKIAPLGVVAGQQDCLAPKDIGIILEIGVHLAFDVGPLGIEFVVLGTFGIRQRPVAE